MTLPLEKPLAPTIDRRWIKPLQTRPRATVATIAGLSLAVAVILAWVEGNLTGPVVAGISLATAFAVTGTASALLANGRLMALPVLFAGLYIVFLVVGSLVNLAREPNDGGTAIMLGGGLLSYGLAALAAERATAGRWRFGGGRGVNREPGRLLLYVPIAALIVCAVISTGLFLLHGTPFLSESPNLAYVEWAADSGRLLLALEFGLPIASLAVVHVWGSRGRLGLALSVVAIALTSMFLLATTRRYQLFDFYIALVFMLVLLPQRKIPRRVWVGLLSAVFAILVAVPLIRDPSLISAPNPMAVVRAAWFDTSHRVFGVQANGMRLLVETIPARQPFFGGYTFAQDFLRLPGTKPEFSLGRWLFRVRFTGLVPEEEIVGYYPPTAPGELYANFGVAGVVLGMALWGAAVQLVCIGAGRLRGNWVLLPIGAIGATYLVQGQLLGAYTTAQAIAWATIIGIAFVGLPAALERRRASA